MAERVDNLVESTMRRAGLWEKTMLHSSVRVWNEVVGDRIAANSKAVGVMGKTLVVSAENAGWRHQLHMMRYELLDRMNQRLGGKYIEDIRLTARRTLFRGAEPGEGAGEENAHAFRRWPGAQKLRSVVLSSSITRRIMHTSDRIKDSRLAGGLKSLLVTAYKRDTLLADVGLQRCRVCGALTESGLCELCVVQSAEERKRRAQSVLLGLPWLDAEGLRSVDPELGEEEYLAAREVILALWSKDAQNIARLRTKKSLPGLRAILANMAMLMTNTPPEELSCDVIRSAVGERLFSRAGFTEKQSEA